MTFYAFFRIACMLYSPQRSKGGLKCHINYVRRAVKVLIRQVTEVFGNVLSVKKI